MSPHGRPKGAYRSTACEGTPVSALATSFPRRHGALADRVPAHAAVPRCAVPGVSAPARSAELPQAERAELCRQGAKAAARGELATVNPFHARRHPPGGTDESQARWRERRNAWQAGHDFERGRSAIRLVGGRDRR